MKKKYLSIIIFFLLAIALLAVFLRYQETTDEKNADTKTENSIDIDIFKNEKAIKSPLAFRKIKQPVFPDRVCDIRNYGASTDPAVKNTDAFRHAIDDCSGRGGGVVLVPEGIWLTGPIHLKDNINLKIDKGAEIRFSDNFEDYLPVVFSRFEGIEYYNYSPPIYAKDCRNIAITGEGSINGMAQDSWWNFEVLRVSRDVANIGKNMPLDQRIFGTPEANLRPPFIQFMNCQNILLENFTIINSPMWAINPVYSSDIIVRNVKIKTEGGGRNNDGIDIDSTRNVLIEDVYLNTGDDAIALKSGAGPDGMRVNKPTENIVIRNSTVVDGHAGIAIGSEISGGVRNVFAYNNNFTNAQYGIRIKTTLVDSGTVENIHVQKITMKNIQFNALEIANDYGKDPEDGKYFPPTIRNINFEDIACDGANGAISLRGSQKVNASGLSFKNISVSSRNAANFQNASDIVLQNFKIDSGRESGVENIKGIKIIDYSCPQSTPECFKIKGEGNTDLDLSASGIPPDKLIREE